MQIDVFKFGGASVNSARGVRNVAGILKRYAERRLVVVVSAMGKTTNALEEVLDHYLACDSLRMIDAFNKVKEYHFAILEKLFGKRDHPVYGEMESLFDQLRGTLRKGHLYEESNKNYDFEYDRIVGFGELFSSTILYRWLVKSGIPACYLDAREVIRTDNTYRDARVIHDETERLIREKTGEIFEQSSPEFRVILTQGFIGSDPEGNMTTLSREGSDYSAALFAHALKSEEMVIWKDVPGVMNADPKWLKSAKKLDTLSYRETIELAWFGASVIHPKTIKPLENADIVLRVKSFRNPGQPGTEIRNLDNWKITSPIFIRKQGQVLISISPRDFAFIMEENLSAIFSTLAKYRVKVNVMQNSAISFSVCVDGGFVETHRDASLPKLLTDLGKDYQVLYNTGLELITIRHYNQRAINLVTKNRKLLLEQKTRHTVHLVLG
ncbi:MAG: aspartate kinase [bacterium]